MFRDTHNQKRSTESPMDWEWQTQGGPTDPKSPFPQFKAPEGHRAGFDSPQPKSSFMNASSTPAPQFRNPSFTTPRKPFDPELLSEVDTGAEDSPAVNADAEDTPDLPKQIQTMTVSSGTVRQPLFQRYGAGFLGSSPGQADRRRGKYANQIVNKVRKRKRIDRDYALVRSHRESSETDSDEDSRPRSRKGKSIKEESQPGYLASIFDYIESHPNLPNVLSFYAQLGVNMFIAGLTIFGIYTFWMTIQSDVDKASEDQRGIVLNEIALCAKNFVDNQCGSDRRVPALKEVCENWEHCMNRDPDRIGRARVSATTFAQIFNSFIEPISYKAMIFIVLIVTVAMLVNNLAFGMFRSKSHHQPQAYFPPPPSQTFQWGPPQPSHYEMQTPQKNLAYEGYNDQQYQAIMPGETPSHRSPSKGNRSPSKGNRSPSKGDRY